MANYWAERERETEERQRKKNLNTHNDDSGNNEQSSMNMSTSIDYIYFNYNSSHHNWKISHKSIEIVSVSDFYEIVSLVLLLLPLLLPLIFDVAVITLWETLMSISKRTINSSITKHVELQ